jgi:hypothetical protein
MTATMVHTSESDPSKNGKDPVLAPRDNHTAQLDILLSDIHTYRYLVKVPITPALANRLIDLNAENNRNLKSSRVERYARDMRNGRWLDETGETLKVDTAGRIIDGNHRLHAVRLSGRTIVLDLCLGVPPDRIVVIDSLAPRTGADRLRVSGSVGDFNRVQTAVRRVWAWEQGSYMGASGRLTPTDTELVERYNADAGLFDAAAARAQDAQRRRLTPAAAIGAAYFILSKIDPVATTEFFDIFISGKGVDHRPAIYKLREKVHSDRPNTATFVAMIMKAWNHDNTLKGGMRIPVEKLQLVRQGKISNDNFPLPIKSARSRIVVE